MEYSRNNTKKSEILSEIKEFELDVAVLRATKKRGRGSEAVEGYIHKCSGIRHIENWKFVKERIVSLDITLKGWKLRIIGVYAK